MSPGKLETAWMRQNDDSFKSTNRHGKKFMGLDNKLLAQHFLSVTPSFANVGGGGGGGEGAGVSKGEGEWEGGVKQCPGQQVQDVGERQQRRRTTCIMQEFEDLMSRGGCGDPEEGFRMLRSSKLFKAKYESVVHMDFQEGGCGKALAQVYKESVAAGEWKKAYFLLSLYSPFNTREQTMRIFDCSSFQCKQANLTYRMRMLPKETLKCVKVCSFKKETVEHMDVFVLCHDNVLRAAFSDRTCECFLLKMNCNRLWLKYSDECVKIIIKSMSKSAFYVYYSEKIFKQMTRETCCCTQCINKGAGTRSQNPATCFINLICMCVCVYTYIYYIIYIYIYITLYMYIDIVTKLCDEEQPRNIRRTSRPSSMMPILYI
jgi:hypothetical protein